MVDDVNAQFGSRPMLSVNTSALAMDDWTRSSSPLSSMPATPYFSESPCDPFASLSSACSSLSGSFDDLSTSFSIYNSDCHSASNFSTPCNSVLSNVDFAALSYSLEQQTQASTCGSSLVNSYIDFSALTSIPQYQVWVHVSVDCISSQVTISAEFYCINSRRECLVISWISILNSLPNYHLTLRLARRKVAHLPPSIVIL